MARTEHAEAQLAELELLLSMFPSQEELEVEPVAHAELRAYVEGTSECPPSTRPELCVKIRTHSGVNETRFNRDKDKPMRSILKHVVENVMFNDAGTYMFLGAVFFSFI